MGDESGTRGKRGRARILKYSPFSTGKCSASGPIIILRLNFPGL